MSDVITLEQAAALTRTGDLWLFRGRTAADRAIRALTNAPVNHVGMAVVIDDLPALMWHAELGKSVQDVWTGGYHRGVQLHDLEESVRLWTQRYGQQGWMRQIKPEVGRVEEDAVMRAIARMNGAGFPSAFRLAGRWLRGRDSYVARRKRGAPKVEPEAAFCAEVVAETLQEMGILADDRRATWFDPGTFWSGGYLPLQSGWSFEDEVQVAEVDTSRKPPSSRSRWR